MDPDINHYISEMNKAANVVNEYAMQCFENNINVSDNVFNELQSRLNECVHALKMKARRNAGEN